MGSRRGRCAGAAAVSGGVFVSGTMLEPAASHCTGIRVIRYGLRVPGWPPDVVRRPYFR